MDVEEFINDFYYEKLGFCGCGNPEDILLIIKNLLNAIYAHKQITSAANKYPEGEYDRYQNELHSVFNFTNHKKASQTFNNPQYGIIQFIMQILDKVGVIEHGGSIGGAWLTEYGEELKDHLNLCDIETVLD